MAKVFTITEGLENLGALKSGGQGSVYKAKRSGGLISAVKILPTPISSETDADKNFISFQNEVEKLKRVNEIPNSNVVSIFSSGITSSGNLPFIEMEFIEGPDLGELLTPPHDPVFSIRETIKVADHLSNALAHCHRADVKHGDIKSNNVKFNERTGNYMLLDFGLSVMSDEQRRTSIRYAGAIEFMAPEQSAGETLFETDVYSFGIILFELLAGTVPFPLMNKGEMARNAVMVAHMENAVPDLLTLRRKTISGIWSYAEREMEMLVPAWLLQMIARCLEKDPAKRFKDGIGLQEFIQSGINTEDNRNMQLVPPAVVIQGPLDDSLWREQVQQLKHEAVKKEHLINELKYQIEVKDRELYQLNMERYNQAGSRGISRGTFFTVLTIALGLGGYAMYHSFIKSYPGIKTNKTLQAASNINISVDSTLIPQAKPKKRSKNKPNKKTALPLGPAGRAPGVVPAPNEKAVSAGRSKNKKTDSTYSKNELRKGNKYRIKRNAFFYEQPDKNTRDIYYINASDATLTAIQEQDDFIYVKFIDSKGKTNQTWLAKEDLTLINE
ncbi:MAG: serine/threonine-protein kinase [Ferruginibacter sp.]